MKKVAYITLIAAFIIGVQSQEAFSAENSTIEMEAGGETTPNINFDQNTETLSVTLESKKTEKAHVLVYHNGSTVAQESVILGSREINLEFDLTGSSKGIYTVHVVTRSFEYKERFKKK